MREVKWLVYVGERSFPYRHKKSAEMVAQRFIALAVSPVVRIERCERMGVCEEVFRWEADPQVDGIFEPGEADEPAPHLGTVISLRLASEPDA